MILLNLIMNSFGRIYFSFLVGNEEKNFFFRNLNLFGESKKNEQTIIFAKNRWINDSFCIAWKMLKKIWLIQLHSFISTLLFDWLRNSARGHWRANAEISSWAFWQMIKLPLNTDVRRYFLHTIITDGNTMRPHKTISGLVSVLIATALPRNVLNKSKKNNQQRQIITYTWFSSTAH